MFDLDNPWPGTVIVITVATLAVAIMSALAAQFIDPDLPRSVREAAVSCWAVASAIIAVFVIAVRHSN